MYTTVNWVISVHVSWGIKGCQGAKFFTLHCYVQTSLCVPPPSLPGASLTVLIGDDVEHTWVEIHDELKLVTSFCISCDSYFTNYLLWLLSGRLE